ncbi:MAG TPA: response regulator transcription factor [Pyrinomonadaceae bacterium]|nr:response regulator transcription factor [Pyrinomonadaceae bacterium]
MIRILIADDQALFREALRTLISLQPDLEVIGEAANGEEALRTAQTLHPHVILMDLQMPVLDGVAATRQLHSEQPGCRVIALTTFDDDEYVFECLRAGAVGYLLKDAPSENLFAAIRAAARGESFLQPSVTTRVLAEFTRLSDHPKPSLVEPLSEREREILKLITNGSSNREIAEVLFITEGTVKNHVTNILGKLDVRDRTQAALKARELGFC